MRAGLAGVLALVACLLLPPAIVSAWTAARVTDTDGYVALTAPLAGDPVVRREVSRRLVALVDASVPGDADELFPGAQALGDTVVEQAVAGALRSELFARTWTAADRAAHDQLIAGLRADPGDAGPVTLDLAPVLRSVTDELLGYGLPVAALPAGRTTITLTTGQRLAPARRVYQVLDAVGWRGAVAWLVLVALALALSRARRRTTGMLAWGSLLTVGATLVAVAIARQAVPASVPAADRALLGVVLDAVGADLQRVLLVAAVAALVTAVATTALGLAGRARQA